MFSLSPSSPNYPERLREIHQPPNSLHIRGSLPDQHRPHLAIVGSRKASNYGKRVTRDIATELARAGVVIVSGLAYGIDQIAHQATIDAGGTTMAVLGFGLHARCTQREKQLQNAILASGGVLMSEFDHNLSARKHHFPQRNRIISGVCHGALIVEATHRSGTLITAKYATEQNRDVFAIPGPITSPTSQGTNALLRDGAFVVTSAQDILSCLGIEIEQTSISTPLSPQAEQLLHLLSKEPKHIDAILRESKEKPEICRVLLTGLELEGYIRDIGGRHFVVT